MITWIVIILIIYMYTCNINVNIQNLYLEFLVLPMSIVKSMRIAIFFQLWHDKFFIFYINKWTKCVCMYFFVFFLIVGMFQNRLSLHLLEILHNFKIHHKKRPVTLIYPYLKNHKCWYISTYMWCEERRTVRECF